LTGGMEEEDEGIDRWDGRGRRGDHNEDEGITRRTRGSSMEWTRMKKGLR